MSKLGTLKEWMPRVLFSVGLSRTSSWDLDRKKETGDLRQRAGQRLALGMEEGASPKLEEIGVLGMMEVKVREAGCNGLGLLEFLHGAGFGLNSQGDLMILISRGKE